MEWSFIELFFTLNFSKYINLIETEIRVIKIIFKDIINKRRYKFFIENKLAIKIMNNPCIIKDLLDILKSISRLFL
jgi:hypothetical protein